MGCTDSKEAPRGAARPQPKPQAPKPAAAPAAAKPPPLMAPVEAAPSNNNNTSDSDEGKRDIDNDTLGSTRKDLTLRELNVTKRDPLSASGKGDLSPRDGSLNRRAAVNVNSKDRINRSHYPANERRRGTLGFPDSSLGASLGASPRSGSRSSPTPRAASPTCVRASARGGGGASRSPRSQKGSPTWESPSRQSPRDLRLSPELRSLSSPPLRFQSPSSNSLTPTTFPANPGSGGTLLSASMTDGREIMQGLFDPMIEETDSGDDSDPEACRPTLHVPTLYTFIDQQRYTTAYRGLTEAVKRTNQASTENVLCIFGLAVLHRMSDDWVAPRSVDPTLTKEIKEAQQWLAQQRSSPAALLAQSEVYRAYGNLDLSLKSRQRAAEMGHPLAILRAAMTNLSDLKGALHDGTIAQDHHDRCRVPVMNELLKLSNQPTKVGAKAAKTVYPSFMKGTDGMPRDLLKAKELIEMAIDLEQNPKALASLQHDLQKIHDRMDSEGDDLAWTMNSSRHGSMRRSVSARNESMLLSTLTAVNKKKMDRQGLTTEAVSSLNHSHGSASPRPESSRGRSSCTHATLTHQMLEKQRSMIRSSSTRRQSRQASLNGSMMSSPLSNRGVETVVELEVDGAVFGCLRPGSPPSSRGRKRKSVSAHDYDPLRDGLPGSPRSMSMDHDDDFDDYRSQMSGTSRLGNTLVSQRGSDIRPQLRDAELGNSMNSQSYRKHRQHRR